MATEEIVISKTEWTRITDPGQSGTCYIKTGGSIVIDHTDQETADNLPLSNTNVKKEKSKRASFDKDNNDTLTIPADNVSDVFYALAINSINESDRIVVDVI